VEGGWIWPRRGSSRLFDPGREEKGAGHDTGRRSQGRLCLQTPVWPRKEPAYSHPLDRRGLEAAAPAAAGRPEITNPFNDKETLDDKLSILDIKARDRSGRQFHVEMQMLADCYFPKRIVYYWSRFHQQQLHEGDDYGTLQPTVSICFVNSQLFPKITAYHLPFQLWNPEHQVVLTSDLAIHLIELPKFTKTAEQLVDSLDIWLYFLRHAETLDTDALPPTLNIPIIHQAMEELRMLTQNDLERERYEARVKQQRDERSRIKAARLEGHAEGLIGTIHFCQSFLQQSLTPREELFALPIEDLTRLAEQLQKDVLSWRTQKS
jgi:predicted transposase/invertase (TIGR01784 family)